MAHAEAETTRAKIITDDGTVMEFAHAVKCLPGGDNLVWSVCYINGVEVGSPIRFKAAGNRIAADFPEVSDAHFITDEDGKITNG